MDVIIVGGGFCGLGTALLLARDGHDVTVLETDPAESPDDPQDAWDGWRRKGVAQFRQPHNLMPGLRLLLDAELPEFQPALQEAGAVRFDFMHPNPFDDLVADPIDETFWTYTARRPVAEWVMDRIAAAEPRVRLRRGTRVTGLRAGAPARNGTPQVTGVELGNGETLEAGLVIDATGRASHSDRWLSRIGAKPPAIETEDHGFAYYTRFFRGDLPRSRAPVLATIGTISVLTLPGDNETWSVTLFASSNDPELQGLLNEETWMRVIAACPAHAHWLEGEPVTGVARMGGALDRKRMLVVDGTPNVTGLVAVADAYACTNPSAGRGLTIGMLHARCLRDLLREEIADPLELVGRFDAMSEEVVSPWYQAQVERDRYRFDEVEALRNGQLPPEPSPTYRGIHDLITTMVADPQIFRGALEYFCAMTPAIEVLARPGMQQRIDRARDAMSGAPPPAVPGPDRSELVALLA